MNCLIKTKLLVNFMNVYGGNYFFLCPSILTQVYIAIEYFFM